MQKNRVIIIGAGAAGLMAGVFAARNGADVTILERNEKAGKKIYITGKGRCNVTNTAEKDSFMAHILRNPRFMYSALDFLDNAATMELFESLGVPLKVERGDRVYPVSDHASDITNGLTRELRRLGVEIRYNEQVKGLITEDGRIAGVKLSNGSRMSADRVIVATGGLSYPSTGSTGDGYRFAEETGHAVTNTMPALVPVETKDAWPGRLSGLSLKNVALTAFQTGGKKEKKIYTNQGEMLFTHWGISGPLVLTLSSMLPEDLTNVRLEIDMKPALTDEVLEKRVLRDFTENQRRQVGSVMDGLVPHNLGIELLNIIQLSPGKPVHSVTAEERKAIVRVLKHVPLTPKAMRGYSEAVVTRGGIAVKGINASTMESKLVSGLYFAGETMDVDATTGGYNLQIAFSTGALAGYNAAQSEEEWA